MIEKFRFWLSLLLFDLAGKVMPDENMTLDIHRAILSAIIKRNK